MTDLETLKYAAKCRNRVAVDGLVFCAGEGCNESLEVIAMVVFDPLSSLFGAQHMDIQPIVNPELLSEEWTAKEETTAFGLVRTFFCAVHKP